MKSGIQFRARAAMIAVMSVAIVAAKPVAGYIIALDRFNIATFSVAAGGTTEGKATLTGMTKGVGVPLVTFASSNSSIVTVPTMRTASLDGTVIVPVYGVSAGCANIRASYGGQSRSAEIVVQPAAARASFSLSVPDGNIPWPGQSSATLTKTLALSGSNAPGSGGTLTINPAVWTLTSSNPNVATVPATVTQVSQNTTFKITGKGDGCATITAKLGSETVSKVVRAVYISG